MHSLLQEANELLIAQQGAAGRITLNRPVRRNALSTAMRAAIAAALPGWVRDPNIYGVVVASAAPGVFCAGGDLRELIDWGRNAKAEARSSLAAEYALNWRLECFTKPTVSLIDGLVVGSGVGLSLYGTHRVAGENYRFAMPETHIGLFPDDGVCHAFARMPDHLGTFLALTGRAIGPADAYPLGLATHVIPAADFGAIAAAMAEAEPVDQVLDSRHQPPRPGELTEGVREVVARCFAADTVEEIIARLQSHGGPRQDWAQAVAGELTRRSPTSLKLTHRHLIQARGLDLRATLVQDYRIAHQCLEGEDLYEGVRAVVIDKDGAPRWRPGRLADVTEALLAPYFAAPVGGDLALASRAEMQALQS
ncbi:MAG TPA: enoyl-CoA hydratase/isomerase family protein [Hyphomicrobiaceae bacterium]|nr:enoyl-CoA hydratase/isomerase family protein [Hyphomicrobiaceae bacterium]